MKRITTILSFLMLVCMGTWAENVTWESKTNWVQASGGVGHFYWYGVHTPGAVSTKYSLNSINLMMQTGDGNNDAYLAIARVSATSTLDPSHVVAISSNHLSASQSTGTLVTYNFSSDVELLGGTTYYLVFLSNNTLTNGTYPVTEGRLSLNHKDYSIYPYGNSAGTTGANYWPYYQAILTSSSATDFCTGTDLGGSLNNGSSGWSYRWTSGTSPSFTMTSDNNNINKTANNSNGMDIRSGQNSSSVYTIQAPTGYLITGYKLFGSAITNDQIVTPAEGGSAVTFTQIGNSLKVSELRKAKTSFTLSGGNTGLFLTAMQVTLSPYTSITELPTSNNKAYVIANVRGTWNFADDATSMSVVTPDNTSLDNEAQQVALIYRNENYYLYSINAGKYLTANNTLTSMPTDNEQVEIVSTNNTTYPWLFRYKNFTDNNKYTKTINVGGNTNIQINGWGPNGSNSNGTIDDGNRNAIIPAGDYNLSTALSMFDTRTVTYYLNYGGNSTFRTVNNVTVTVGSNPADFVPSEFIMTGVSLSYSPATITTETTEVTVTATWNGPFQISSAPNGNFASDTKWYTIAHNYTERANNYIWNYNGTDNIVPEMVATDNFAGVTDNHLFCFVGDPYSGFTIYNKGAGSSLKVYSSGQDAQVTMNATATQFIPSKTNNYAISDGYFSLKPSGSSYYLNWNKVKLAGWNSADDGGTCWVIPEGKYYLTYLNSIHLDAPVGAVGTKSVFVDETSKITYVTVKTGLEGSLTYLDDDMTVEDKNTFKTQLSGVKDSETITLANGYYRIQNAYENYSTPRDMYYSHSNGTIRWSKDVENDVNSIFYLTVGDGTFTMKSPNANKYVNATTGTLSESSADVTYTQLEGTLQYNLKVGNTSPMHTNGHSSGSGTEGNIVAWDGNANTASAWYIVKASTLPVGLHTIGEVAYATTYLPFDVTIEGADAYTLERNGEYLVPTQLDNNEVPAGTAVLLKGTSATATATINNTGTAFSTDNTNALAGSYVDKDFELVSGIIDGESVTAEYFLGADGTEVGFYHSSVESKTNYYTMGANKAYLPSGTTARGFAINWNDASSIQDMKTVEGVQSSVVYDLQGRRVANPQHGMYIKNGRVMVVK